jgi:hypothetical protein
MVHGAAGRELCLDDRGRLGPLLDTVDSLLAEYCFANLYLFRKVHHYRVVDGPSPLLAGVGYDGEGFLLPLAGPASFPAALPLLGSDTCLFPVDEGWLGAFPAGAFSHEARSADADYLYPVERLATLAGRKLHGKRNLLKQFLEAHVPVFRAFSAADLPAARDILDGWLTDVGQTAEATDHAACAEAILLHGELGLEGLFFAVDGQPGGFLLGERRRDSYCLHFAKGLRRFKGLYQFMYATLARGLPAGCRYVNFEQDLGKPALQIAKASYLPERLLPKFRVRPSGAPDPSRDFTCAL